MLRLFWQTSPKHYNHCRYSTTFPNRQLRCSARKKKQTKQFADGAWNRHIQTGWDVPKQKLFIRMSLPGSFRRCKSGEPKSFKRYGHSGKTSHKTLVSFLCQGKVRFLWRFLLTVENFMCIYSFRSSSWVMQGSKVNVKSWDCDK